MGGGGGGRGSGSLAGLRTSPRSASARAREAVAAHQADRRLSIAHHGRRKMLPTEHNQKEVAGTVVATYHC